MNHLVKETVAMEALARAMRSWAEGVLQGMSAENRASLPPKSEPLRKKSRGYLPSLVGAHHVSGASAIARRLVAVRKAEALFPELFDRNLALLTSRTYAPSEAEADAWAKPRRVALANVARDAKHLAKKLENAVPPSTIGVGVAILEGFGVADRRKALRALETGVRMTDATEYEKPEERSAEVVATAMRVFGLVTDDRDLAAAIDEFGVRPGYSQHEGDV